MGVIGWAVGIYSVSCEPRCAFAFVVPFESTAWKNGMGTAITGLVIRPYMLGDLLDRVGVLGKSKRELDTLLGEESPVACPNGELTEVAHAAGSVFFLGDSGDPFPIHIRLKLYFDGDMCVGYALEVSNQGSICRAIKVGDQPTK